MDKAVICRQLEWAGPAVIEGWAPLPELVATIADPRLYAVWIEAPEAMMRVRLEADVDFVRGAGDPVLSVNRLVSRSTLLTRRLRVQASACGLPYVGLSGLESPHDVASRCLEAVGLHHWAIEHWASGGAPSAARP